MLTDNYLDRPIIGDNHCKKYIVMKYVNLIQLIVILIW